MKISEKINYLRKMANISQEELAEKLFVSRQTVSKWEQGKAIPDTEKVVQISKLFNVSLDELLLDEMELNFDRQERKISEETCMTQVHKVEKEGKNDFSQIKRKWLVWGSVLAGVGFLGIIWLFISGMMAHRGDSTVVNTHIKLSIEEILVLLGILLVIGVCILVSLFIIKKVRQRKNNKE